MKQGRSIQDLAAEIQRQADAKKDFLAETTHLEVNAVENKIRIGEFGEYEIGEYAHSQIRQRLDIPAKYYKKMQAAAPELLEANVNHWFQKAPERRMVRTLDGTARAFLSGKYKTLDNIDLAECILPIIAEKKIEIVSSEITENRLYIKGLFPAIETEVTEGDVIQAGIAISNSEIGDGALRIEPLVFRLVCKNGMIAQDYGVHKHHVGRALYANSQVEELWTDKTRKATDRAFWFQAQDTVRAVLNRETFDKIALQLTESAQSEKIERPTKAIEKLAKKIRINETESDSILNHLAQGGDMSQWGAANAITRYSQDVKSYDRATDLENLGWKVIQLSAKDWHEVATA